MHLIRIAVWCAAVLAAAMPVCAAKFARVLIMSGQSNMGGTLNGNDVPTEMANQTNVWFDSTTPPGTTPINWIALGISGGGPEVGNGYVIANALPDEQIVIVKDSAAATGIDYWRLPGQAGFVSLTNRIAMAKLKLDAQQLAGDISGWRFAGFFWMQGEAEANAGVPSPALTYFTAMTDLVYKVRLATGVSDLPVVLGRTHVGITINNQRDLINVRSNQVAYADSDPYGDWVNIDDVGLQDGLHLNSPGSLILGLRMGPAYLGLAESNPCIWVEQAPSQPDPTDERVVRFSATCSKPVTGFDGDDVLLGGTAGARTAVVWRTTAWNGTSEVYTIAVGGMTNYGTVVPRIPRHVMLGGSFSNFPSFSIDNTLAFGITPPVTNLLAHDDGNLPAGLLQQARTGFGWRNYGWVVQNSFTQGYILTTASPMAYSNLQVNAPYINGGWVYNSSGRDFDCLTALRTYHTEGDLANLGRSNDEFWVSFLARRDQNKNWALALCRSGVTWVGSGQSLAVLSSGGNWALQLMGDPSNKVVTSTAATLGQTFLMVLRIRCAGVLASNVVDLFINPAALGDTPPAVPSATLSVASSIFKFARIYWYPGDGVNNGSLDEFRLGTTYAAVTPVWPTNSAPTIVTTNLPPAALGQPYGQVLRAASGDGLLTWSVITGSVPAGLELGALGTLSGIPSALGTSTFTVQATDGDGQSSAQELSLLVVPEPAMLALACVFWMGNSKCRIRKHE